MFYLTLSEVCKFSHNFFIRCQGRFYHTKIRICFHERRLQYMEKEQLETWKQMRPGERILEVSKKYGL